MEHTVKKKKGNRIAMRFTAGIFILIAGLRFLDVVISQEKKSMILTIILCAGCLTYGIILLRQTFKPQAYDITYVFGDRALTLKLYNRELQISYGEIKELGYVIPNENLDYSLIQIYIENEQYVIPFTENSNVGKALYEMLKMKKEEADQKKEKNV